jgi:tRNA threonylcarbamoyladenosine biosynthesis protein TsaB
VKILAFDTSTPRTLIALVHDDQYEILEENTYQQQSAFILSMIHTLLEKHAISLQELNAIAYGGGPGSFTGNRLAACLAQGFAFALHLPLIRISSLAIFAMSAYLENKWDRLLVGIDAHQQEIYFAAYAIDLEGSVNLLRQEQQIKIEELGLIEALNPHLNWYGVGNAWEKYKEKMLFSLNLKPKLINFSQVPNAKALALLARCAFAKKDFITISETLPVYLR